MYYRSVVEYYGRFEHGVTELEVDRRVTFDVDSSLNDEVLTHFAAVTNVLSCFRQVITV